MPWRSFTTRLQPSIFRRKGLEVSLQVRVKFGVPLLYKPNGDSSCCAMSPKLLCEGSLGMATRFSVHNLKSRQNEVFNLFTQIQYRTNERAVFAVF